jgi:hypothetical protein
MEGNQKQDVPVCVIYGLSLKLVRCTSPYLTVGGLRCFFKFRFNSIVQLLRLSFFRLLRENVFLSGARFAEILGAFSTRNQEYLQA